MTELKGRSLIAGRLATAGASTFTGFNPVDGSALAPAYHAASLDEVEQAVAAAAAAAPALAQTTGQDRAKLLRSIADAVDAASDALVEQAHLETALPARPRLAGEVARTSGQLRLFAQVLEEGSWVTARIDTADSARIPPRPDLRSMLRPLGPVVVFGASNFPLAFSVAGGDFASALAAGNPVLVKAHPAHPATSELVGRIVTAAVAAHGFPAGTFSLLFDDGYAVGTALVKHPAVRAVGFTGSFRGGRALVDLAAQREQPIPVYAEMGSTNPVFILPGALAERGEALATGLQASYTLGGGQFCTKPGVVFFGSQHGAAFLAKLRALAATALSFPLLTGGIAEQYERRIGERQGLTAWGIVANSLVAADPQAAAAPGFRVQATLVETVYADYQAQSSLRDEVFGPTTVLVHCRGADQMLAAAHALEGHLTATILGTEQDLAENAQLLAVLETKAGRVIVNAFPTGVEVNHAMVHGGPYPATADGRSTSVGCQAIFRFARPVAYQGLPQSALPPALRDNNPLNLLRLWNGSWQHPQAEVTSP